MAHRLHLPPATASPEWCVLPDKRSPIHMLHRAPQPAHTSFPHANHSLPRPTHPPVYMNRYPPPSHDILYTQPSTQSPHILSYQPWYSPGTTLDTQAHPIQSLTHYPPSTHTYHPDPYSNPTHEHRTLPTHPYRSHSYPALQSSEFI